eukprot:scaffold20287_cov77-Skeletonema_dohrnii-CCMP3373.AAC.1
MPSPRTATARNMKTDDPSTDNTVFHEQGAEQHGLRLSAAEREGERWREHDRQDVNHNAKRRRPLQDINGNGDPSLSSEHEPGRRLKAEFTASYRRPNFNYEDAEKARPKTEAQYNENLTIASSIGSTPMTTDCSTITMTDSDSTPSASTSIITMSTPRSIDTSTSARSLLVESSKSGYYQDVSCVPPVFQLQRPGESMRERFECDEVSWDSSVVGDLLIRQELQLYFTTVLEKENIVDLLNKMNSLCENDHLLLEFVRSRNTMYNGGPNFSRHAYDTLSKIDCFKDLFASIENGGYKIGTVYNGAYGEDFGEGEGRIDLHQDASYRGTHRLIFPIGCINKELWFKKGKKVCGLRMHHGSVVCMSHRAGGVIGSVYHAASRCGKSWILVIEVSKKK